jgi:ribosomal-protein-alanine N-acetyltransferase
MDSYIISTERLGLRNWLKTDIEPFAEMNMDADVMRFFPETLTFKETTEVVERIHLHFEKNSFGLFAVENKATAEFIGFTGFAIPRFESFFTPCIEIGWRYKKDYWGQGLATEAARACVDYGFKILQFEKIVSFTSVVNVNSEKVMRRIGMSYVSSFDHPNIPGNSVLCKHVVYEITRQTYLNQHL